MDRYNVARPVEILLVEDNPGDVRLLREAMRHTTVPTNLRVAADGVEALAKLRAGMGQRAPQPDVIFLDLNLPGMSGTELLATMKADALLRRIPIIILTSSDDKCDVARSYDLGANCYVTKPIDFDRLLAVIATIEQFWLTVATLPSC